jgi:hypothetical protein
MPRWEVVAAVAGSIAVLGVLLDSLLLRRHRGRIYQFLLEGFIWLDDRRTPELPQLLARRTDVVIQRVAGQKLFSVRSTIVGSATSALLTFTFLGIGYLLFRDAGTYVIAPFAAMILLVLVPVNGILDLASFAVFRWTIGAVANRGFGGAWLRIVLDLVLSLIFAIACLYISFKWLDAVMAMEEFWEFYRFGAFLLFGLSSLSVFLPMSTYFGGLFALWILKGAIAATRSIGLHILEVATEEEEAKLKLFTLIGGLFAFVSVLAKTAAVVSVWLFPEAK